MQNAVGVNATHETHERRSSHMSENMGGDVVDIDLSKAGYEATAV